MDRRSANVSLRRAGVEQSLRGRNIVPRSVNFKAQSICQGEFLNHKGHQAGSSNAGFGGGFDLKSMCSPRKASG